MREGEHWLTLWLLHVMQRSACSRLGYGQWRPDSRGRGGGADTPACLWQAAQRAQQAAAAATREAEAVLAAASSGSRTVADAEAELAALRDSTPGSRAAAATLMGLRAGGGDAAAPLAAGVEAGKGVEVCW